MAKAPVISEVTYPIQQIYFLRFLVFVILIVLSGVFTGFSDDDPSGFLAVVFGTGLGWYFYTQIKNFHYRLDQDVITIHQGVFSKQERHLPYHTIQNVFIKQGLLDSMMSLSTLVIENAGPGSKTSFWSKQDSRNNYMDTIGSNKNSVNIPGLAAADAEKLKTAILEQIKNHPVNVGSGL